MFKATLMQSLNICMIYCDIKIMRFEFTPMMSEILLNIAHLFIKKCPLNVSLLVTKQLMTIFIIYLDLTLFCQLIELIICISSSVLYLNFSIEIVGKISSFCHFFFIVFNVMKQRSALDQINLLNHLPALFCLQNTISIKQLNWFQMIMLD